MAQLLLAQGRCLDSGAKADFHYTSRRAPGQVVLSQVGLPAPARTGCCQHGWLAHRQRMPSSLRYRRATGASPSARTRSQFSITLAGHRVPWLIDPHTRGTIDRTRRGPSPTTWTVPIELRARSRVPVLFPEKNIGHREQQVHTMGWHRRWPSEPKVGVMHPRQAPVAGQEAPIRQ
jgi:hypothetical protein